MAWNKARLRGGFGQPATVDVCFFAGLGLGGVPCSVSCLRSVARLLHTKTTDTAYPLILLQPSRLSEIGKDKYYRIMPLSPTMSKQMHLARTSKEVARQLDSRFLIGIDVLPTFRSQVMVHRFRCVSLGCWARLAVRQPCSCHRICKTRSSR